MKHIFYFSLFAAVLFSSCKSAPKTTFVNTGTDTAGNIYSVCIFSEITDVTAIEPDKKINAKHPLAREMYSYNPETTELKIRTSENYSANNITYHIEGKTLLPAEFILHLYDKSKGDPAVFYDGKNAVSGKDYSFDKNSAHLTFLRKIDADKNSYLITWTTADGMSSIGNKTEKYQSEYNAFIQEWIKTLVLPSK